uniref:aldehyde oxygenase (deformylating) n=1 Tax=Anthurium amnicola TaxID=1678845 RepID=A0A1D1YBA3_9ARAE
MALGMSDELLPMVVPIAVYWITSGIYYLLGLHSGEKHRLFTEEEEDIQNLATKRQVLVGVVVNQAIQLVVIGLVTMLQGTTAAAAAPPPTLLRQAWQMAVAYLIIDAWEYFFHRMTHEIKFLYKHVHAMHHRMIVPYSFGAQYIHPLDAFFGNMVDSALATTVTGMSPRTATVLFSLMAVKSIDDHCALWFPNNPFHRFFTNNSAYHAIHHQHYGIKYNYSGFYLATWDKLLGTAMPFTVEERKGGGYQIRTAKDD